MAAWRFQIMKHAFRRSVPAVAVAMALALALSTAASAKPGGHGDPGRRESSESRGNRSERRGQSGERSRHTSELRDRSARAVERGGEWRTSRAQRSAPREHGEWRGSGSSSERRYREPRSDRRPVARWQDSGGYCPAPTYRSQARYRHDGPSYSTHRSRSYYTDTFCRPRFMYRSGFSLGFVIGSVPQYGYRYIDPYCDMAFRDLDSYYDHCDEHGHADLIQVCDSRTGSPIAISVYRDGDWVIDDCD